MKNFKIEAFIDDRPILLQNSIFKGSNPSIVASRSIKEALKLKPFRNPQKIVIRIYPLGKVLDKDPHL